MSISSNHQKAARTTTERPTTDHARSNSAQACNPSWRSHDILMTHPHVTSHVSIEMSQGQTKYQSRGSVCSWTGNSYIAGYIYTFFLLLPPYALFSPFVPPQQDRRVLAESLCHRPANSQPSSLTISSSTDTPFTSPASENVPTGTLRNTKQQRQLFEMGPQGNSRLRVRMRTHTHKWMGWAGRQRYE